jgi:hypothetical protein
MADKRFFDVRDTRNNKYIGTVQAIDSKTGTGVKIDGFDKPQAPDLEQLKTYLTSRQAETIWRATYVSGETYGFIRRQGLTKTPLNPFKFELAPPIKSRADEFASAAA